MALLLIAVSASYLFFVVMPATQRHRDELAAETAKQQARERQIGDCAEQSRRAGQDMGKYNSGFGPSSITGVSNHYNHRLSKCIVDVQTLDKGGTVEFVMDAYEQSSILWCSTRLSPTVRRFCMDARNNPIDPTEADKQIDTLLKE